MLSGCTWVSGQTVARISFLETHAPRAARRQPNNADALGVSVEDVKQGFVGPEAAEKICRWATDLEPQTLVGKAYDTLFKARCAAGRLRSVEDRQVLAPFCNVSMLAGAALALELVRRINRGTVVEPYNYWRMSPWHAPVVGLRDLRRPVPGCEFCGQGLNLEVARDLWGHPALGSK